MTSATTLAVLVPMLDDKSFLAKLLGMIDLFLIWQVIVLSMGLAVCAAGRSPIATALLVVYAHYCGDCRVRPTWSWGMSRKKIIIGVVIVFVLGAIAFANVKFKRTEGLEVHDRRRAEAAISKGDRVGVGQDSAEARRQHQRRYVGRVTELAVEEGDRVKADSSRFRSTLQPSTAGTAEGGVARRSIAGRATA